MNIGIAGISYYLPQTRTDNLKRAAKMGLNDRVIHDKIGMIALAKKSESESTSSLAVKAIKQLLQQQQILTDEIQCLVLVTQNPDGFGLPHTSAIVHATLNLPKHCAVFDVSLGCSGYVYGLSILKSFMESNGLTKGILVTADPYSQIVDEEDKNTSFLFGDAATASLLKANSAWQIGACDFGTNGSEWESLQVDKNRKLQMNGRQIFNFSAQKIPESIHATLEKNQLLMSDIDQIILHQGSRYIVETIAERIGAQEKTSFLASLYGNTISSSIPLVLAQEDVLKKHHKVLVSGFGVGLSWATTILTRVL